jgi:hypothetical protein
MYYYRGRKGMQTKYRKPPRHFSDLRSRTYPTTLTRTFARAQSKSFVLKWRAEMDADKEFKALQVLL